MAASTDLTAPDKMSLVSQVDANDQQDLSVTSLNSQELDRDTILRQVEHYFSDENLQTDAHLLGKLEEGNGSVSVKHILGFSRMRKYKPASAVREILKESTMIEVINDKLIRRRQPFNMASAKVNPSINQEKHVMKIKGTLQANPHLTKSLLKRTGFERDHIEPNLSADDQQLEAEQYSTDIPVYERLENAVLRFKMNRKFHQYSMSVFHAFLNYGGFDERPPMFTGGMSKEEAEGLTKEEKARRKQNNYVSAEVMDSLNSQDGNWVVDFEGVTKGFFSTHFSEQFLWHDDPEHDREVASAACNVLRNFFAYLLYHNVCIEFTEQIHAARFALETVETEFVKLDEAQQVFPGSFNIACSTLMGGHYAKTRYQGSWMTAEEVAKAKVGLSDSECKYIVLAGVAAFAAKDQLDRAALSRNIKRVGREEDVGLEVTRILLPGEVSIEAQKFFENLQTTIVPRMGKLICKRFHFAKAAPLDLPHDFKPESDDFEFIADEASLEKCFTGMKLIATVDKMDCGLYFIDHWSECYGSFYTWCWNEKAMDRKQRGGSLQLIKPKSGHSTKAIESEKQAT